MKKLLNIILAGLLLATFGCKKTIDFFENHASPEINFCQIHQFDFIDINTKSNDTVTFAYNAFGNPVTAIRKYIGTGSPNFIFKYDKYNRLTDLIGIYDINNIDNVESWHKYFYNRPGQIVLDSFYLFPKIINGQPTTAPGDYSIITYEYDFKNRIIKATTTNYSDIPPSVTYIYYSYDKNNNLVGTKYDDKINLHRTNKIWMFLDRNYSLNNPATATYKYNNLNLPIDITFPAGSFGQFMHGGINSLSYQQASIKYNCDIKNHY